MLFADNNQGDRRRKGDREQDSPVRRLLLPEQLRMQQIGAEAGREDHNLRDSQDGGRVRGPQSFLPRTDQFEGGNFRNNSERVLNHPGADLVQLFGSGS